MGGELQTINQLFERLAACMPADRHTFKKRLHGLRRRIKQGQPVDRAIAQLLPQIEASAARLATRAANLPPRNYPEALPVSARRDAICEAIKAHQVVIVAGETGSGKTTQLPKICLDAGRGINGLIGHTQPRRIAARSVAGRIASELGSKIGEHVGYKVRFSDKTSTNAYIKLMTDGILLAEIQSDPQLSNYDTIIIDEAHERSLNIDFLLGYLKQLLPKRPDLKLIITSATINTERFSRFFNDAPVIEVSGRTYPVELRYRPIEGDEDDVEQTLPAAIAAAANEATTIDPLGDILVFLPGEREIREASDHLQQAGLRDTEIVPLLSRLSPAEQDRVFQSHTGRRIVLATNVAETSLTVPGIRFVIDSGLARISRYSARTKVQRLPIEPISQASANQRAGRCGRVAAGTCFRLYSVENFEARPAQTDPEILRTNLASVILQMSNLGLGDLEQFPFMEPPDKRAVRDGYLLLEELQAISGDKRLTDIGRKLVRLPVDPRFARMLLAADQLRCLHELIIIVAAMSVQEPRLRPMDAQQQADAKHRQLADPDSDFAGFLKLWNWYHEAARHHSRNQLKKLCHDHFISWLRMREWHDLHGQLLSVANEMGLKPNREPAASEPIHRALLTGLLSHIGCYDEEKRHYHGARNLKFTLFPGSSLYKKPPKWIVCAALVETARLYGRTAAPIDPAWLEPAAAHLLKRSYSEPHWSQKRGEAVAYERVTLFGITIVAKRAVRYSAIDAPLSRELLIRHALVQFEYRTQAPFMRHNRRLIAELEAEEAKTRRRDLLIDEAARVDLFDGVIPEDICNMADFEKWRRTAEKRDAKLLFLNRKQLLIEEDNSIDAAAFPNHHEAGKARLKLDYNFVPGEARDGITLRVPLAALGGVDQNRCDWLVPGMLEEKIAAMIKSLPKMLRRNFVPVPDVAARVAANMRFGEGSVADQLALALSSLGGVTIRSSDFTTEKLPPHLTMQFAVIDDHGREVARDRDLVALQQRFSGESRASIQSIDAVQSLQRDGITRWDFGDLPETVSTKRKSMDLALYPALSDAGDSVEIRIFESRHEADISMREGLCRLFMLHLHQQVAVLKKSTPALQQLGVRYALIGDPKGLKDELIHAAFAATFLADPLPRSESDFASRLDRGRPHIVKQTSELADNLGKALTNYAELTAALDASRAAALKPVIEDIRTQMAALIYPGFIGDTPAEKLAHLPRYIEAAKVRLGKAGRTLKQDQQNRETIERLWSGYKTRREALDKARGDLTQVEELRWLIEELRVSLFAQELGTAEPVSTKRLTALLQQIQ